MSVAEHARVAGYYPAVVRTTPRSGYYLEYYVFDPMKDVMVRRTMQLKRLLKRYKKDRERRYVAQRLADELNVKLSEGWTPLHETEDGRLYTPITELREIFLKAKEREGVRPTTLMNYSSFTRLFIRWCEDTGRAKRYSGTFLKADAVRYMDSVQENGNGNRSYNNTIKAMRCFFNWAMEHCYCKENPFDKMKLMPKQYKRRVLIDTETRMLVADYFRREKPQMLLVSMLVYSSAIRPKEIANIQLKHIDIERHHILIEESNAKNHKARRAAITKEIVEMISPLLDRYPDRDYYLFGTGRNMEPGAKSARSNYFAKCWDKMRDALGLPMEMQLYSLRDTGLTDLLHAGVDQLTVQHHADHSSLAIQNIYTDHYDPGLVEKIYEKSPKF